MSVFKRIKQFAPIAILFCLLSLLSHELFSAKPNEVPSALIGETVPTFEITDLNHVPFTFTNDNLKGQVSLLNVWATWCYACKLEHSMLMKISQDYHVPIYGIAYKDQVNDINKWLSAKGNPYKKIGNDANGDIAIDLGIVGTPETFIINAKGEIVYKHIGGINEVTWVNFLYPMIQKLQKEQA